MHAAVLRYFDHVARHGSIRKAADALSVASSAVNRQILMHEVWGYNSTVTTHTLETHIYRLRQKIEADPARPSLLVTEGGGYRLRPDHGADRASERPSLAGSWQGP